MPNNPKRGTAEHQINENLKRVYSSVADEELPDRFKDLLAQLKTGSDTASNESSEPGASE